MTHKPEETIVSTLNHLLETAKDGENGFQAAAEDCTDPGLKQLFGEFSHERGVFATELQTLLKQHGTEPDEIGSLAGAVHRGWINLKSALSTREDLAVLEECERGEDSAIQDYRKALGTPQLGEALAIVQKQYDHILSAHRLVKNLRDKIGANQHPH